MCLPAARRESIRWSRSEPSDRTGMRRLRATWRRLTSLFRKEGGDREFDQELASHLQAHTDDNLRAGMPLEEARRQAFVALGAWTRRRSNTATGGACANP